MCYFKIDLKWEIANLGNKYGFFSCLCRFEGYEVSIPTNEAEEVTFYKLKIL
jgi:hypothetical protein